MYFTIARLTVFGRLFCCCCFFVRVLSLDCSCLAVSTAYQWKRLTGKTGLRYVLWCVQGERWTQLIRSLHGSGLGIPWVNQRSRLAVSEQIGLRQLSGRVTWKHGCAQDFSLEGGNTERPMTTESGGRVPGEGVAVPSPPVGDLESAVCELHQRGSGRREREFYSQLHCRHTRRAIIPSKLVPMLSNIYNERYTKENIHRRRRNRQYGKTNKWKKNKLCAHTITRQARTIQAVYNIINDNFVTNYTDKMNENAFSTIYHIIQHTELQPTATTPCNLWIVERCDLIFALKTHWTTVFHEFAPNSVNMHFPIRRTSCLEQSTHRIPSSTRHYVLQEDSYDVLFMRPSSLGGGRILRRTLSVRLSVRPSRYHYRTERHVAPPSELKWHTCTFRHALRAAYRTAISAAQILVLDSHLIY